MKILFIYKYGNIPGGIQKFIKDLGNFLRSEGNRVYILSNHPDYKEKMEVFEDNLEIFYWNTKNIARLLFEKEIDIICVFEPHIKPLFLTCLFKIIKPHTSSVLIFCGSKTETPGRFFHLFVFLRLIFKFFDTFIAISRYAQNACFKKKFLEKVQVMYIPIELEKYRLTNFTRYNLLTIGRICKRKNYEDLIEIFENVHQTEKTLILDIIGGLEEINIDYFNYIRSTVKEKKLENFVNFHINISEEEKLDILSQSTLYLTTSKHEMLGISTVEAMASGIPIIAYNNTATREICSFGKQILVKEGAKDEMADKILKLIRNKEEIQKLSKDGKTAAKLFESKEILDSYMALFVNLFQQQKKREKFKLLNFEEKVKQYMKAEGGYVWRKFDSVGIKKVLDIGCGEGIFFMTRPGAVVGIDKNKQLVELCKDRNLSAKVVDVETESLPFRHNCFDGVVMMRLLEHLYIPKKIFLEINRVLKLNGLVFIIIPTKEHENYWQDYTHVRPYTIESLGMLAEDTGFEIDEYFYTGNEIPLWRKFGFHKYINPAKIRERLGLYHRKGNIWAILRKSKECN